MQFGMEEIMSTSWNRRTAVVVCFAMLALSACSSATPAATSKPATPKPAATTVSATAGPTKEATKEPTKEPTKAPTATAEVTEAAGAAADLVQSSDQKEGTGDTLVVAKVVASADGWIVIHADADGKPGTVLGYAAVKKGENDNVKITLTDTKDLAATEWAMLHVDAG